MYIPKSVLLGLLFVGAGLLGWVLHSVVDDDPAALAAEPVSAEAPAPQPEAAPPGDTIVNLTIAGATPTGDATGSASVTSVSVTPASATTASPPAGGSSLVPASTPAPASTSSSAPATTSDGQGRNGSGADRGRAAAATSARRTVQQPGGGTSAASTGTAPTGGPAPFAPPAPRGVSVSVDGGDRTTQAQVQDVAVSAIGDHIVIAYDDSIVYIGDDGRLTANTGDASSSGTVALDVAGSSLTSGTSASGAPATSTRSTTIVNEDGTLRTSNGGLDLGQGTGGRAVSIAGFEDHSLDVAGRDNIVTYDDSNVFIARNGQINANTGDTDSSGLNVVDATRSVVRSGDHSDDGGEDDGEEPEEPEEPDEPEEEAQLAQPSTPAPAPVAAPAPAPSPTTATAPTTASAPAVPRATASVSDDDGGTTASGDEALVIGGDGYDDLAVDVAGEGNIATYDDSNVVVGGTGGVNAQIGDSDTGGAVVMGVEDSVVEGGNSS
jgi:hypothetical protein